MKMTQDIRHTGEIILYQPDETVRLERQRVGGLCPGMVRLEDEIVWLTQAQIAELFHKFKSTISFHISNIFTGRSGCSKKSNYHSVWSHFTGGSK